MKDNIETETPWLKFAEKVISQRKCISWTKSEKLIVDKPWLIAYGQALVGSLWTSLDQ